jgi:hypothetical protein
VKIVMTLLVRNEEDIIEDNLVYHLNQGVDFVIVTDNRSRDRTRDLVRPFERWGVARLLRERRDNYMQPKWVSRMANLAHDEHRADWVVHNDADEFWWPEHGDLRAAFAGVPAPYGVVAAPRVNFRPTPDPIGSFHTRMTVRDARSTNSLGDPLPPKVAHRGVADAQVGDGNHELLAPALEVAPESPVTIFHFPLRSVEQLRHKVTVGGRALERNRRLPADYSIHWREMYRDRDRGAIEAHYEGQVLDDPQVEAGLRDGTLVRDTRLHDFLLAVPRRPPFLPAGEPRPGATT